MHSLILGHSLCARLEKYLASGSDPRLFQNFKLGHATSVAFYGVGGIKLSHLLLNDASMLRQIALTHRPDIVFLQIGGNDIGSDSDPHSLANQMVDAADRLVCQFKVQRVVIGAIMPRFVPEGRFLRRALRRESAGRNNIQLIGEVRNCIHTYNECAHATNAAIRTMLDGRRDVQLWQHNGQFLWYKNGTRTRFQQDGVHHSRQGSFHFYKSIRGALISTCAQLTGQHE
jgi:lysophospholipase L1-like esterase